jgi:hypothetical protein
MRANTAGGFEWRDSFGSLRWLILGSLGLSQACGGRTQATDQPGQPGQDSTATPGQGGAQGHGGAGTLANTAGFGGVAGVPHWSGGAGSAGVGGSAGTSSSQPSACVFEASLEGGFERCQNGLIHRAGTGMCSTTLPRPPSVLRDRYPVDAGFDYECVQDSDCTAREHGHCEEGQGGPSCAYGCQVDAECAAHQLCLCGSPVGECVTAVCRSDAECGPGLLCASMTECYSTSFSCQQPEDECAVWTCPDLADRFDCLNQLGALVSNSMGDT